ncbi:MAG TPA: Mur ligase family protein, partial [Pirellulales bacterium]|nr:Mur ligase family protein [Pirellulales bacterium]
MSMALWPPASVAFSKRASAPSRPVVPRLDRPDWNGKRVTVMGLGRHGGNVSAVRYLALQGALVTVSDQAERSSLGPSLAQIADIPLVACHFGGHDPRDFECEYLIVNPAVRPDHPALEWARAAGAQLVSETELFLAACPAKVIGVTGSNGKSTTASMLFAMMQTAGRTSWLGGNIGSSLLGDVSKMRADDWVVLEMSSFQLAHLSPGSIMPEIAVITNCAPNHLDWHGDYEQYAGAKQRLLREQDHHGVTVLNAGHASIAPWARLAGGRVEPSWPLEDVGPLSLPGIHNLENAACAAAAATIAGIDRQTIREGLARFRGLDHRLQRVAGPGGRRFYNDSKSTSPGATLAALSAIDGEIWLLLGGQSKGVE